MEPFAASCGSANKTAVFRYDYILERFLHFILSVQPFTKRSWDQWGLVDPTFHHATARCLAASGTGEIEDFGATVSRGPFATDEIQDL